MQLTRPKINANILTSGTVLTIFGALFLQWALQPEMEPYNLFSAFMLYFASLVCIVTGISLIALSFTALTNTIKKTFLKKDELNDWFKGTIFLNGLLLVLYISFDAFAWFNIVGIFSFSGYYSTYNFLINTIFMSRTGTFFFQNTPLMFFITSSFVNIAYMSIMIYKNKSRGQ